MLVSSMILVNEDLALRGAGSKLMIINRGLDKLLRLCYVYIYLAYFGVAE